MSNITPQRQNTVTTAKFQIRINTSIPQLQTSQRNIRCDVWRVNKTPADGRINEKRRGGGESACVTK